MVFSNARFAGHASKSVEAQPMTLIHELKSDNQSDDTGSENQGLSRRDH